MSPATAATTHRRSSVAATVAAATTVHGSPATTAHRSVSISAAERPHGRGVDCISFDSEILRRFRAAHDFLLLAVIGIDLDRLVPTRQHLDIRGELLVGGLRSHFVPEVRLAGDCSSLFRFGYDGKAVAVIDAGVDGCRCRLCLFRGFQSFVLSCRIFILQRFAQVGLERFAQVRRAHAVRLSGICVIVISHHCIQRTIRF
mmetsp:Transcript_745/g.1623  ORF Transcript_745/g.1623 Transcript_745/m.1623 type:complete len:201 (-) Transcript_745:1001-1603(-)